MDYLGLIVYGNSRVDSKAMMQSKRLLYFSFLGNIFILIDFSKIYFTKFGKVFIFFNFVFTFCIRTYGNSNASMLKRLIVCC